MLSNWPVLQLGLLRVITWHGSRFKKQRIKAQNLFVPARSPWCSSNLNSANRALDLAESLLWYSGDGSDFDNLFWIGSHFFLLRVCRTSFFFDFIIPIFCLNCFFLNLQSAGWPSFVSLLHRFWLIRLLFWEIMTACPYDYMEPSLSFALEGLIWCYLLCTWINWENYPAPGYD